MSILQQNTINNPIELEGISLHKGKMSKIKILPSGPNTGIIFKRVDLKTNNLIEANFHNVSHPQEQIFSTGFLAPALKHNFP